MSDTVPKDEAVILDSNPVPVDEVADIPLEEASPTTLPEQEAAKRSKKRIREASLEPLTPKDDDDSSAPDVKEVYVPPKKNRLRSIEPTVPEETVPLPVTPPSGDTPLSTSPPHESKVRQIRKRVKDLSWKEARRRKSDEGSVGEPELREEGPEAGTGDATSEGNPDDESSKSVSAKSDSDKDEVEQGKRKQETAPGADPPVGTSAGSSSNIQSVDPQSPTRSQHQDTTQFSTQTEAGVETNVAGPSTPRVSPPPPDSCQGKRRREDGDQNPREAKRISPPPDQAKNETKPPSAAPTGFLAYASSASPFATASNAPNVFGSSTTAPVFGSTSSTILKPPPSSSFTSTSSSFLNHNSPAPVKFGASGFDAYASTSSPFGAPSFGAPSTSIPKSPSRVARSKSPGRHANAFGPYTSRSGRFAATPPRPVKKVKRGSNNGLDAQDTGAGSGSASGSGDEVGDEEPEGPSNFGDILSAKEDKPDYTDEEKKVEYTEQEVVTGEEDERTEYQVRAKLYAMEPPQAGWKERGAGMLKLNVNKMTGRDARLVLRTDGVLRLVLNTTLFSGMNFEIAQDPRYVRFGIIRDKGVVLHALRVGSVKHAEDLLEQVKAHLPGPTSPRNGEQV